MRSFKLFWLSFVTTALVVTACLSLGVALFIVFNENNTTETVPVVARIPDNEEAFAEALEDTYYPYDDDWHFIAWRFTAYTSPNFMGEVVGVFDAQYIPITYMDGDWMYASNIGGWVYTAADKLYTGRIMGVFDSVDGDMVSRLGAKSVEVIERDGDWIHTSEGWLYLNFTPAFILEEFMAQFGNTVAVYYENLESGFIFRHHADRVFFGASATKAPFALYIYLEAEQGRAGMSNLITYTTDDFWEGSGVIRHQYALGTMFTRQRLLHLMLVPSDNVATRMLRRSHGLTGYSAFVESIGADPNNVHNLTYSRLTANDAGIFMREAFRYIESGGIYSEDLRSNLLANRYPFIISDYPVASKSGWAANFGAAWHDMAIVYAPSPYILALLSNRDGNASDRRVYESISMFIQAFNSEWF